MAGICGENTREKEVCRERTLEICIGILLKFLLNTKPYVRKPGKKLCPGEPQAEQSPELSRGWEAVSSDQPDVKELMELSEKNPERACLKK